MLKEVETVAVQVFLLVLTLTHMAFYMLSEWEKFRTIYRAPRAK